MRIYVGRLAFSTSEQELNDLFKPYDPGSVSLIVNRETGESRGFGFVEIRDAVRGRKAISELDGKDFGGRLIQVNEARDRDSGPSHHSGGRNSRW